MALDVAAVRARFPSLAREHAGRPYVYLDGPGGTQVVDAVVEAVVDYYRTATSRRVSRATPSSPKPEPPSLTSSAPRPRRRSSSGRT